MKVYDEYGHTFKVQGGDPAARVIAKLTARNYSNPVVLPLVTLVTGKVVEPAAYPDDIVRSTRLRDCLAALGV